MFQWLKHHPTGPIESLVWEERGGLMWRVTGTHSHHTWDTWHRAVSAWLCQNISWNFIQMKELQLRAVWPCSSPPGSLNTSVLSSDEWKPIFGLSKVLRGSSYDVYKGQMVTTRVGHVMRGTSGVVPSPTGLYISFDTLRARLARDLSRI